MKYSLIIVLGKSRVGTEQNIIILRVCLDNGPWNNGYQYAINNVPSYTLSQSHYTDFF